MSTIRIAVLMTVHNRKDSTLLCLERLYANKLEGIEISIYLVEDGCTDGTGEAITAKFPDVFIIKGDGNLYWNRGMYLAWKEAMKESPDFYLWLNDDTYIYETAVEMIISNYNNCGNKMSIVSGSTCSKYNKNIVTYGGLIKSKLVKPDGCIKEIDEFQGNFVLVPQCVVDIIGILDYKFRHSMGDTEYAIRARNKGIKIYLTPSFVGTCEPHPCKSKCFDESYSLSERLSFFYSPLGAHPSEVFYLNKKRKNSLYAVLTVLMGFMNVLFPVRFPQIKNTLQKFF